VTAPTVTLHATCVAVKGLAVLLVGPSGVGKSDVALRLIDMGAELVADDQTMLHLVDEGLEASPPESLAGLIELRHVGLLRLPYRRTAPVALYVELLPPHESLERLPAAIFTSLLDRPVRWLKLHATDASTPAKIRMALQGTWEDVG